MNRGWGSGAGTGWVPPTTRWVGRLLIANGVAFFLTLLVGRGLVFDLFAFHPSRVLVRPWGAVTYLFLHGDFWHLLFNMLALFFFGPPLEERWGGDEFLRFYLIAALGGVAFSFLFAFDSSVIGASAAIYGIMMAFALTWPDAPIHVWGIFPVPARWLVGFLFVVSLVSAFGGAGGGVAHFAHLGGLVTGFLWLRTGGRLQRLSLGIGRRARAPRVQTRGRPPASGARSGSGDGPRGILRVLPGSRSGMGTGSRPESRAGSPVGRGAGDAGRSEAALLDAVDRVLDKISASGMASLTPDERALLDEVSRRHRTH